MKKKRSKKYIAKQSGKQNNSKTKKTSTIKHQGLHFYQILKEHFYNLRLAFIACLMFGLFVILLTFFLSHITGLPFSYLSRDMAAILHAKEMIGFLSNIGILLWASTAAICIFSAFILKQTTNSRQLVRFFLFSGLLTLWFALDDVFLFHEQIFPKYFNIPETIILGSYACITIVYTVFFIKEIISKNFLLFLTSGVLLAASLSADIFFVFSENETILEDSLKFLGITFWLGYFSRTALLYVRDVLTRNNSIRKNKKT